MSDINSASGLTLPQTLAHIEELKRQAEEVRRREFQTVVMDMKAKIAMYGITAKDLGFAEVPEVAEKKDGRSDVMPKYRGPKGETWSGRGKTPTWLANFIENGGNKDELLINKEGEQS